MITPAQHAEIRRVFYGEHWRIGTIATQLGLHRETVRAAVERETGGVRPSLCPPSILDPFLPFIRDTLAQYPRLRATRIHEMVRQRGYAASVFPVRRLVRRLRPETNRAVYRRVVTLVGEQAQVDWGSFGKVRIGQGTRTVSGFVMVLGYSRALAALFTHDQTLESFLRGHVHAFEALGGAARNLVYDNLRSAVLDRRATTTSVRAPTMNGVQYAKKAQTSRPRLLSSRSTCFTPCLVNVPMAWAKPRPTAWIASEALVSTPRVALANDSTRLACRSPSYKVVMKFRRSCLRSHCPDEAGRS